MIKIMAKVTVNGVLAAQEHLRGRGWTPRSPVTEGAVAQPLEVQPGGALIC